MANFDEAPMSACHSRGHSPPRQLIAVGAVLGLAGAFGLSVAAAYAPTLTNALTREWVLTPAAYALLRLISFMSLSAGVLLAIVAVVRHESRSDDTPPTTAVTTSDEKSRREADAHSHD